MVTTAEQEARVTFGKMISDPDPLGFFRPSGYHPYTIGAGPSESTFIDSLKLYPDSLKSRSQRISVFFGCIHWGSPNFEGAQSVMRDRARSKEGLPMVEAQIMAACRLNYSGINDWDADRWAFIAKVVTGEWKDRFMIGFYRTEAREGYFDLTALTAEK